MIGASQTPKRMMRKPSGEIVPLPENGVIPDGCAVVAPMVIADAQDDRLRRSIIADEKERRFTFNDAAQVAPADEQSVSTASDLFAAGSEKSLTSAQVSEVVFRAEVALAKLRSRSAALRAATLDPAVASEAVSVASSEAAAVDLEADRMEVCASRLRDRAKALAAEELDAPRRAKYEAAKAARATAEAAILEQYPALADAIADLLRRALEADRLVGMANGDLPRGMKPLPWTHDMARQARVGPVLLPACNREDHEHWPGNAYVV